MPDAASLEMVREYIQPNMKVELTSMNLDVRVAWNTFYNDAVSGMGAAGAVKRNAEAFDAAVDEAFKLFNK
jgi:hypothetical protein